MTAPSRRFRRLEVAVFAILVLTVVGLAVALHERGSSRSGLQGSGKAASQTRSVPPFTEVELAGVTNVFVTAGASQRVVVHADDNLLDHVTTRVVSGRLVVGNTGSFDARAPMSVEVVAPELDAIALTGGGVLNATKLDAAALTVTLSGGGLARASGSVGRVTVLLTGGGAAQLGALVAQEAHVRLSGAGLVVVEATDKLDATLAGAGSILFGGNPAHVTTRVTGTGVISAL